MKGADRVYSFGSDEYIQRVVERYSKTLLRVAYNIVHSTAASEDVVQDVLLSLITSRPRLDSEEYEKAWLIRATVNKARNELKRNASFTGEAEEVLDALAERGADKITDNGNGQNGELLSAVLSLPDKYSVPVHLYYYEGYSTKEIAEILRLPQATVCTRLSRALALLRDMLEE